MTGLHSSVFVCILVAKKNIITYLLTHRHVSFSCTISLNTSVQETSFEVHFIRDLATNHILKSRTFN
jgi:hypothetical protein